MSNTHRRRNYPVIHRDRQYRVLVLILIYGLVICIYLFLCMFLPDIVTMQDPTEHWTVRSHAADRILMMNNRLWPAVLAMLSLVGLHSFRMFTYLIGPLVPIRRALVNMAEGNFTTRLKLRKKDLLLEEAELFNYTSDKLCDRIGKAQTAGDRAARATADLRALADDPSAIDRDKLNEALTRLEQQVAAYRDLIYDFKVDAGEEGTDADPPVADLQPAGEHAG